MNVKDWPLHSVIYTLSSLLFLFSHPLIAATLVNITVDDSGPDPITGARIAYSPSDAWSFGQDCTACTARPDPAQAFMRTWHDGTFNAVPGTTNDPNVVLNATFSFESFFVAGSAIYVYCILAHTSVSPDGNSDITFLIDGEAVGSFFQAPNNATNYGFNVPVYTNASIPSGNHTFTLQNGHVDGPKSLVLLDYIVYT
ncbi:hypothetical protein BXZ70DRAFT_899946 [Cristinia sonorae]|uniref:Uncharacterized protein n=1 Tax=Cristinia sonorae TaxID=1940300 RepID=A0A8K0UGJ6_9AGAR|nr:hypothetical protein BXZ70DRAFT_899946 [Cristinia sonorae]